MSQEFYDCIGEWADRCAAQSKEIAELKAALAAKEQELERVKQERDQSEHGRQLHLKEMQRCLDRLAETFNLTREGLGYEPAIKEIKHQLDTLTAEAVKFAKGIGDNPDNEAELWREAYQFLARPDVIEWQARQKEGT